MLAKTKQMDKEVSQKNKCKICGNSKDNILFTAKEMMYGFRDQFHYFQCNNCHCLQIKSFPTNISRYYPTNYYSFGKYDGKKFKGLSGLIKRKRYSFLLTGNDFISTITDIFSGTKYDILRGLEINKKTKILDVGCGNGKKFLYPLAEIGFKNLKGCDPFLNSSLSYDNGLEVQNSTISDVKGKWDIITYHHSFEHIPNPLENLKKVCELLEPDGVCILRIPTVSSFAWEEYGVNWVQLDAPRHFFLHSKKSMQLLGEKSNLELYKVEYDSSHFQFTGSEKYIKDIPLRSSKSKGFMKFLKEKLKQREYQKKAELLNKQDEGDQAAFFFRNSGD